MQAEARAEIDKNWKSELNAKNKAKANINEETIRIDWVKQKSKAGQIKYYGSKSRWALVESGVVTKDSQLFKTITTPKGKVTVKKTLKELNDSGIITVSSLAVKHSSQGGFSKLANPKKSPSLKNGGRPNGGGHSQRGINKILERGWTVDITKTYKNGVRIGNIPEHTQKFRRSGSQMSWFPENWTDDDILIAGTNIANNEKFLPIKKGDIISGYRATGTYNNVVICITKNLAGQIDSIYPKNIQ